MAGDEREPRVSRRAAGLISVDGVNAKAVTSAARGALSTVSRARRGGVSWWDASGLFEELTVAGTQAGVPSVRTLLLLYAADLAFRLRWEIQPALARGRTVVAAPYIDTPIALGMAAGLDRSWLDDLFGFALTAGDRRYVDAPMARSVARQTGFVEFSCEHSLPMMGTHRQLVDRALVNLKAAARINRHNRRDAR
jgi:hypothetical protein